MKTRLVSLTEWELEKAIDQFKLVAAYKKFSLKHGWKDQRAWIRADLIRVNRLRRKLERAFESIKKG